MPCPEALRRPSRAVLCCRPVSFRDLPPLRVPPGYTVVLYCSGHTLGLSTPQGPVDIGSGGTLRFIGCAVETYGSTAAARDAAAEPPEAIARTLVNGQSGSRLQVEHSSLLMPWKVRLQLRTARFAHIARTLLPAPGSRLGFCGRPVNEAGKLGGAELRQCCAVVPWGAAGS